MEHTAVVKVYRLTVQLEEHWVLESRKIHSLDPSPLVQHQRLSGSVLHWAAHARHNHHERHHAGEVRPGWASANTVRSELKMVKLLRSTILVTISPASPQDTGTSSHLIRA